jgi:hypothetical protein
LAIGLDHYVSRSLTNGYLPRFATALDVAFVFATALAGGVNGLGGVFSAFVSPRRKRSSAPGSSLSSSFFLGELLMAPQPLSSVIKGSKSFQIGPNAVSLRPNTAIWIAQAIANWSRVDMTIATLFICMTGDKWDAAAELYGELESDRAKDAAIRAVALSSLSNAEHAKFSSHFAAIRTARKTRNKFAHWIWGACDQIENGLIAIDPRYLGAHSAKMLSGHASPANLDTSKIYVFTSSYTEGQAAHFQDLALASSLLTEMAHLQGAERAQRYDGLSRFAHLRKA